MKEIRGTPPVDHFTSTVHRRAAWDYQAHLLQIVAHERLGNFRIRPDRIFTQRVAEISERSLDFIEGFNNGSRGFDREWR